VSFVLGNPIRYVDPEGLLSQEMIASSLGLGSDLRTVLQVFNTDQSPRNIYNLRKWGLLEALLDAEFLDSIQLGIPRLAFNPYPDIKWGKPEIIFEHNCQIWIGSNNLATYFYSVATWPDIGGQLNTSLWRDTSPSFHRLLSLSSQSPKEYVDGDDQTDLPDFRSLDGSVSVGAVSWTPNLIADKFGNIYYTLQAASFGPSYPYGLVYSEGYFCEGYFDRCTYKKPTAEQELTDNMPGGWSSMGVEAGVGAQRVITDAGKSIVIYSQGFGVGLNIVGRGNTKVIKEYKNVAIGWDRIEKRILSGTSYADLMERLGK
jgi:hypothetical protein